MCETQRKEQANLVTELQPQADSKGYGVGVIKLEEEGDHNLCPK